jgi:Cupin
MYQSTLIALLCAAASVSASPLLPRNSTPSASTAAAAPNPTLSLDLLKDLAQEPTTVDRFTKLIKTDPKSAPLKFDFNPAANAAFPSKSGGVTLANRKTFAPLVDLGISSAMGFMSPCSLNTAHTHPRASEFLTVVSGQIDTGFILETGLPTQINTTLTKFQGTVFPVGSIHFQSNNQCEDAVFVAGLNSDDPGVSFVAQNFFSLSQDVVEATLGFPEEINGKNFQKFKDRIPVPFAKGVEECLKRCGLPKV